MITFGERVLVTPALEEPITLAEAKAQCREDSTVEDYLFVAWMRAAREYVEQVCDRALLLSTWDYFVRDWPCEQSLYLPLGNVGTVTSVTYYGADDAVYTLSNSNYYAFGGDYGRISLKYSRIWPTTVLRPDRGVAVRYTAGWPTRADVPEDIKNAIRLLVGHFYANREAVVIGKTTSAEGKPLPLGVDALLANHRLY